MVDILRYIHENIRKPLVMAEVAKQFGFSKWHFWRFLVVPRSSHAS